MTDHSPKIAALLAYEEGLLSADGRRRLEAHLERCPECRRALASMRLYEQTAGELRAERVPEPDYSRMELALKREARQVAKGAAKQAARQAAARAAGRDGGGASGGRGGIWLGLAVAAAAILGFAWWSSEPASPTVRTAPTEPIDRPRVPPPEPERPRVTGEVTLATADVTAGTGGDLGEAEVGTELVEGTQLATGEAGIAHLWFYEGTGAVVAPGTRLEIAQLRTGRVGLTLERGSVASEVATLGEGDVYEVVACGFTARVRGTRFSVVCQPGGAAVTVDEGVVEIVRDGQVVETLDAPGQWAEGQVDAVQLAQVPAPAALSATARAWPVLSLPDVDWVQAWEVDDRALPPGRLAMRIPAGEHRVMGAGPDGRSWRAEVVVGEEGHFIEPEAIRPSAPPVRVGYLDPQLIAPVVRQGQRRLQACQEQVDRATGDTVIGRFTLRVTIGRTGEVQRAELLPQGEPTEVSPAFQQCVLGQVRLWSFPPPTGGIVTFEQPLAFGTRATHRIR